MFDSSAISSRQAAVREWALLASDSATIVRESYLYCVPFRICGPGTRQAVWERKPVPLQAYSSWFIDSTSLLQPYFAVMNIKYTFWRSTAFLLFCVVQHEGETRVN